MVMVIAHAITNTTNTTSLMASITPLEVVHKEGLNQLWTPAEQG